MEYQNKGTELQIRELMRRCQYLPADIYSSNKPPPFLPKPHWFYGSNSTIHIMLNVGDVASYRKEKKTNIEKFKAKIYLQGVQNKAYEYANLTTEIDLIDDNGRDVFWSISDADNFLRRATFNTLWIGIVTLQWGEFMAGRWNQARSTKLANQFLEKPVAGMTAKASEYRAKAALIVNGDSQRATDLIAYASNLEAAVLFGTDIESNNF